MSWPEEMSFIANSSKIDRHKGKYLRYGEKKNPRGCIMLKVFLIKLLLTLEEVFYAFVALLVLSVLLT